MKLNKWTVGLAAVGAISLSSAVQAEETQMNVVNAATSGTTIGGYVNTSFHYNFNTAHGPVTIQNSPGATPANINVPAVPAFGANRAAKANGFNLDVVNLTIEKPLDESEWAAGYKAELLFGQDATVVGTQLADGDAAIKQAYVNLRTPVGNGLELKMGVFDTIIGYEAFNANANPNYTRSLAWSFEPTEHTGLLASYRISDIVSVSGGIADTWSAKMNDRAGNYTGNPQKDQFNLAYMGAIAVTAPEDMGALAGSTLYVGAVYGVNSSPYASFSSGNVASFNGSPANQANYYAGATLATGVEGLSVGAAVDYIAKQNSFTGNNDDGGSAAIFGLYASFQATEKLSLHARGEYGRLNSSFNPGVDGDSSFDMWEGTLTAQYDLWQNVITRLEYRWDSFDEPFQGDAAPDDLLYNAHAIMLNVIYVF